MIANPNLMTAEELVLAACQVEGDFTDEVLSAQRKLRKALKAQAQKKNPDVAPENPDQKDDKKKDAEGSQQPPKSNKRKYESKDEILEDNTVDPAKVGHTASKTSFENHEIADTMKHSFLNVLSFPLQFGGAQVHGQSQTVRHSKRPS